MPRDAVSRTANVERNGGHKWAKVMGRSTKQCPLIHQTGHSAVETLTPLGIMKHSWATLKHSVPYLTYAEASSIFYWRWIYMEILRETIVSTAVACMILFYKFPTVLCDEPLCQIFDELPCQISCTHNALWSGIPRNNSLEKNLNSGSYEWAKWMKFLSAVLYGSPRGHSIAKTNFKKLK